VTYEVSFSGGILPSRRIRPECFDAVALDNDDRVSFDLEESSVSVRASVIIAERLGNFLHQRELRRDLPVLQTVLVLVAPVAR